MANPSLSKSSDSAPRLIPEVSRKPVKADLRKGDIAINPDWLKVGEAIDDARRFLGWTLDQLAREIAEVQQRACDEAQLRRWIAAKELPQIARVFSVQEMQEPLVIALACRFGGSSVQVETVIRVRRSAA